MLAEDSVVISKADFDQYKQFEEWVLYYLKKNGTPCKTFQRQFPNFPAWWAVAKDREARISQQNKLDEKINVLLPLLADHPTPHEAAKAIVLTMSPTSMFNLLVPKVVDTPVSQNDEEWEEEEEDDEG